MVKMHIESVLQKSGCDKLGLCCEIDSNSVVLLPFATSLFLNCSAFFLLTAASSRLIERCNVGPSCCIVVNCVVGTLLPLPF